MPPESTATGDGALAPDDERAPGASPRDRILAAAREIIVEEGYGRLSLERVAERARVARATIYYQFGSKAGLLEGLVSAMELGARIHESRQQDHGVDDLLRRVSGLWENESDVLRIVVGTATADPQIGDVVHRHQGGRRQRIAELVEELDAAGRLRLDRDDAVDLLWLLTGFEAYDFLRQLTSREPDDVRRLLGILAAGVVDPDDSRP